MDLNKNIKIIDFGISINDNKNYFKGYGNTRYCSKSQLTKGSIDFTTDIYSLGVIFYELILGKLPFEGTKKEIRGCRIMKKLSIIFIISLLLVVIIISCDNKLNDNINETVSISFNKLSSRAI